MDAFEADGRCFLGSLMLEPLVMGAGGMILVDPLFQRLLVKVKPHTRMGAALLLSFRDVGPRPSAGAIVRRPRVGI